VTHFRLTGPQSTEHLTEKSHDRDGLNDYKCVRASSGSYEDGGCFRGGMIHKQQRVRKKAAEDAIATAKSLTGATE
jgi:hypothetical protein